MEKQVTCFTKRDHQNPHERILGIGGANSLGIRWWRSEDDAIRDIETPGGDRYFTSVNGKSVKVVVATHSGRKYLKTEADGYAPNNLLNLNDCPR